MKKVICISIAAIIVLCAVLSGCTTTTNAKSPASFTKVRWYAPDYSFRFTTSDGCRGTYKFENTKYNIQVKFDGSMVTVTDTDKNKELFNGDWSYEENERLYIYNITYNTKDYKAFETNYAEYVTLSKEKV